MYQRKRFTIELGQQIRNLLLDIVVVQSGGALRADSDNVSVIVATSNVEVLV